MIEQLRRRMKVAADPLKDIGVLENVQFVMKDGVVYKQNGKSF